MNLIASSDIRGSHETAHKRFGALAYPTAAVGEAGVLKKLRSESEVDAERDVLLGHRLERHAGRVGEAGHHPPLLVLI